MIERAELVYIKIINDRATRVPRRTLAFRDAKCDHLSDRPFVAYESPERELFPDPARLNGKR